ncbi:aminopeptidase-like protein 6 [Leptotrombidium deliense]|uniref:Aminopeptidase-like protein 6 n=1 Tax=Leptotrombidium deliense TaxID=299467 RepID=A0A443SPQ6_9ACAR|nr:aminopeptidase-like protein 6 [Leptotrombidium deliense]
MERFEVSVVPFKSDHCSEAIKDGKETTTNYDAIILLTKGDSFQSGCCANYMKLVNEYKQFDKKAETEECLLVLPEGNSIRRLVHSPIGPLNRDTDDVRRFRDAAYKAVKRALAAGATKLLIGVPCLGNLKETTEYCIADAVAVLGALEALYVPLEIREAVAAKAQKVLHISFCGAKDNRDLALAIEAGRVVARDIGGSDPERMSPPKVAEFVQRLFTGSSIKVKVIDDQKEITNDFPCLAAVNRGSADKHAARVVLLTYEPEGPVTKTIMLVGKGVCYDTGGHDIKAGGVMAGMHRDKCGAAAVAGFLHTVDKLKPKGIRVVGAMAMVRNSIGPNAYVSDELMTSRAGVRIRIGNTDAEGRMAMVDVLCYMKEQALAKKYENPHLFTIATLTGHAVIAVSESYSIVMDNGPAKKQKTATLIQEAGDKIGDPFEISTIRREDYEFNKGKSEYEDVLQCNNLPSTRTCRGHQIPAAFMVTVSGLDKHGLDSEQPLPYSHIDIAGSSGPFPGIPSGAPIPALTVAYLQ